MYVDYPSSHQPKDLVDLEGSMGHDGDADRLRSLRWSASQVSTYGSFYSRLHFLGPGIDRFARPIGQPGFPIGLSVCRAVVDSRPAVGIRQGRKLPKFALPATQHLGTLRYSVYVLLNYPTPPLSLKGPLPHLLDAIRSDLNWPWVPFEYTS